MGSTTTRIETRWINHRSDHSRSSILFEKHGYDNCKFIVLEVCPLEERLEKEQWWLDHSVGVVNKYDAIYNTEKRRINSKAWREANNKRLTAYHTVYREENKEKIKETVKLYHEANKEKIKEYQKQYYEAKKASK